MVLRYMQRFGRHMAERGWKGRSGRAEGADIAFEAGACEVEDSLFDAFLPWNGFGSAEFVKAHPELTMRPGTLASALQFSNAVSLVEKVHPVFTRLKPGDRKLHLRNAFQVLGADLNEPVNFVICWTPDGAVTEKESSRNTGGTRTAIVLAERHGIPVVNLARPQWRDDLRRVSESVALKDESHPSNTP